MSVLISYGPYSQEYIPAGAAPPPSAQPVPVGAVLGTVTELGDDYGVILQDHTMAERESPLPETNATQPHRPVTPDTIIGRLLSLIGWRVSPQGKIHVPIDRGNGPIYWQWFIDVLGQWNADNMRRDGNGFFDGNENVFMCSPTGGDLVHIIDELYQHGWYDICETIDVNVNPARVVRFVNDEQIIEWYYKDKLCSYELTPHLFATRTNRRETRQITWLTSGGVNNVSDATGSAEHWPLISNRVAAQPRSKVRRYPKLPCELYVSAESLVVDGNLEERQNVEMMVDAYCFRGSDTFIREQSTGLWYKGDEMLVRAVEPYAATGFDYRAYLSFDGKIPWMTNRGYRSPVPNWQKE
jgi:hypothetical protein